MWSDFADRCKIKETMRLLIASKQTNGGSVLLAAELWKRVADNRAGLAALEDSPEDSHWNCWPLIRCSDADIGRSYGVSHIKALGSRTGAPELDLVALACVSAILFSMAVAGKRAARRAPRPAAVESGGPGLAIT
jgi:hypothetical protein